MSQKRRFFLPRLDTIEDIRAFIGEIVRHLNDQVDALATVTTTASGFTDNAVVRADGTGGAIQDSGVTIDDANQISMPGNSFFAGGTSFAFYTYLNTLNAGYGNDDDTTFLSLNFLGYQSGTARFRDLAIHNGKQTVIAYFDGSTGRFAVGSTSQTPAEALDVTGNIAVSGTVDGRDVATDGSKLDGIEAAADVTDATNVAAATAVMDADFSASSGAMAKTGAGTYEAVPIHNSLTIASGTVALPAHTSPMVFCLEIDTEGDAATDDLDTITGLLRGDVVIVRQSNAARDITFKHNNGGTGEMELAGAADVTFGTVVHSLILRARNTATWDEIGGIHP